MATSTAVPLSNEEEESSFTVHQPNVQVQQPSGRFQEPGEPKSVVPLKEKKKEKEGFNLNILEWQIKETKKDVSFLNKHMKYFFESVNETLEKHEEKICLVYSEKYEQFMDLVTNLENFEATSRPNAVNTGRDTVVMNDEGVQGPNANANTTGGGALSRLFTAEQRELIIDPVRTLGSSAVDQMLQVWEKYMGQRPSLSQATYKGQVSLMIEVMDDTNINEVEDDSKFTPLHLATRSGHIEAVLLLLRHPGININARDAWNGTPLHNACAEGFTDIVRLMIASDEHKLEINSLNNFGQTALDLAVRNESSEIADLLKIVGARDGATEIARLRKEHASKMASKKAETGKQPAMRGTIGNFARDE